MLRILLRAFAAIVGAGCGAVLGACLGFAAAVAVALLSRLLNPDAPDAESVGIIVIFTVPLGFLLGIVCGAWGMWKLMERISWK